MRIQAREQDDTHGAGLLVLVEVCSPQMGAARSGISRGLFAINRLSQTHPVYIVTVVMCAVLSAGDAQPLPHAHHPHHLQSIRPEGQSPGQAPAGLIDSRAHSSTPEAEQPAALAGGPAHPDAQHSVCSCAWSWAQLRPTQAAAAETTGAACPVIRMWWLRERQPSRSAAPWDWRQIV